MAMLSGFDHLTLLVDDLEEATRAYAALMGAAPTWRGTHPDLGTAASLFGLGNAFLELVSPVDHDPRSEGMRALLAEQGEGAHAIAFAAEDVTLARAALREGGLRVSPPESGEAKGEDGAVRSYRSIQVSPRQTRGATVLVVERPASERAALMISAPEAGEDALVALDHIVLRTADPDGAIATYGEGMGIRLALDRTFGQTRMLFFRVGGVTLEVVGDAGLGAEDALWGFALRARDLEGAHARMAAHGFKLGEIRPGNKPGTQVYTVRDGTCGVRVLVLRDPSRD